jgi:hypothetical protein
LNSLFITTFPAFETLIVNEFMFLKDTLNRLSSPGYATLSVRTVSAGASIGRHSSSFARCTSAQVACPAYSSIKLSSLAE